MIIVKLQGCGRTPVAIPKQMKWSALSFSGKDLEKFVKPSKASAIMTAEVNILLPQ
jgi:hypothetical protein